MGGTYKCNRDIYTHGIPGKWRNINRLSLIKLLVCVWRKLRF